MTISHPTKILVPVETALREWNHAGGICQEKKDGCFAVYQVEDFTVTAEKMADGEIFAFDLVSIITEIAWGWLVMQAYSLMVVLRYSYTALQSDN